jgi:hypothetical protein
MKVSTLNVTRWNNFDSLFCHHKKESKNWLIVLIAKGKYMIYVRTWI